MPIILHPVPVDLFTELAWVQTQIRSIQDSGVLANSPDVEVDENRQSSEGRHSQPGQHENIRQHDELHTKQSDQKYYTK